MGTTLIIILLFAAFGLAWQLAGASDERERHRWEMRRTHLDALVRQHRIQRRADRAERHRWREEVALGNNPDEGAP